MEISKQKRRVRDPQRAKNRASQGAAWGTGLRGKAPLSVRARDAGHLLLFHDQRSPPSMGASTSIVTSLRIKDDKGKTYFGGWPLSRQEGSFSWNRSAREFSSSFDPSPGQVQRL